MGVRNKFCASCARTKSEERPKEQVCFKNWKNSDGSSAMEASIVVERFKQSESTYGIRYHRLIAVGDSSVYKKILDALPYKNVEKGECRNHLLRNFCKKLRDLCTKKDAGKLEHRRLLQKNILRLRKRIVSAILFRQKNKCSEKDLQNDIINSINHVLGEHNQCAANFCGKVDDVN